MRRKYFYLLFILILSATAVFAADTNSLPFVSPMFGDDMVLQRDKPNTIWGWANPGDKITVEIAGKSATAIAGADGKWQTKIQPPPVGGPYTLKIFNSNRSVEFHEVLVGDVWLCGGQSNMEFGLSAAKNGADEVKAAEHPEIRLFFVHHQVAYAPAKVPQGQWKICSPQTVTEDGWGGFSAVAYFFATKLQSEIHVPIGLVEDCWGGTPAESWTSPEELRKLKVFDQPLDEIARLHAKGGQEYGSFLMHWLDEYDVGNNLWQAENFDDSNWKAVHIPGDFKDLGMADVPAVGWFRKEINLPNPLPSGRAAIFLGAIYKMDTVYINGQWVGASSWADNPRNYFINDGILKPGKNEIAIRVYKAEPGAAFRADAKDLKIVLGDKTEISLAGEWRGAVSVDARPPHPLPLTAENYPTMPAVLYEGMIAPVAPLAIRGAIWYQGEANFLRAWQYRTLLPAMINDWRNIFGQGDFPFYIASLPKFMAHRDEPGDDAWAELRDAQIFTAQTVKNTGVAITVDTGESDNIHPKDKKPVGERLALCALAKTYGEKIPFEGPTFKSVEKASGALKIYFTHTDGGLIAKGGAPGEFFIAGADHKWHNADGTISGNAVIVSSPEVPEPVAARYAWQSNPHATLFNDIGLPAAPFRTDNWPLSTVNAKPW